MPNLLQSRVGQLTALLCGVALLLCIVKVVYSYSVPTEPAESFAELLAVEQDVGERPADSSVQEAPFEIRNRSKGRVTVVGFTSVCSGGCCACARFDGPVAIEAGERAGFVAQFKVLQKGPFTASFEVYADCGRLTTAPVVLTGTGR